MDHCAVIILQSWQVVKYKQENTLVLQQINTSANQHLNKSTPQQINTSAPNNFTKNFTLRKILKTY